MVCLYFTDRMSCLLQLLFIQLDPAMIRPIDLLYFIWASYNLINFITWNWLHFTAWQWTEMGLYTTTEANNDICYKGTEHYDSCREENLDITHRGLETHGRIINTVATVALVLSTRPSVAIVLINYWLCTDQFHTKILRKTLENEITCW